jgi:hypothetical protein
MIPEPDIGTAPAVVVARQMQSASIILTARSETFVSMVIAVALLPSNRHHSGGRSGVPWSRDLPVL